MTILTANNRQLRELIAANLPNDTASVMIASLGKDSKSPSENDIGAFMDALDALEHDRASDNETIQKLIAVESTFIVCAMSDASTKDLSALLLKLCSRYRLGFESFKYLEKRLVTNTKTGE